MTISGMQALCAFAAFMLLALRILIKRRRLSLDDIGPLFSTFMAAGTLPVALHLCSFVLPVPRTPGSMALPEAYPLYIGAAGLILLVTSSITICQLFAGRMHREAPPMEQGSSPAVSVPLKDSGVSMTESRGSLAS